MLLGLLTVFSVIIIGLFLAFFMVFFMEFFIIFMMMWVGIFAFLYELFMVIPTMLISLSGAKNARNIKVKLPRARAGTKPRKRRK